MSKIPEVRVRQDLTKVIDTLGLKTGVEIGVFKGAFSEYLLDNSSLDILHGVDSWSNDPKETKAAFKKWVHKDEQMEGYYQETQDKLAKFGKRSHIIRATSATGVTGFEDNSLDFIYIDASHRFSGVALDLMLWWPKLKEGGIFAGHDYLVSYRYEVMEAVNGFMIEQKQVFDITTDETDHRGGAYYPPTWWCIKTKMTKQEWNQRVLEALPSLLEKQKKLEKDGVRVIYPYQFFDVPGAQKL